MEIINGTVLHFRGCPFSKAPFIWRVGQSTSGLKIMGAKGEDLCHLKSAPRQQTHQTRSHLISSLWSGKKYCNYVWTFKISPNLYLPVHICTRKFMLIGGCPLSFKLCMSSFWMRNMWLLNMCAPSSLCAKTNQIRSICSMLQCSQELAIIMRWSNTPFLFHSVFVDFKRCSTFEMRKGEIRIDIVSSQPQRRRWVKTDLNGVQELSWILQP